MTPDQPLLLDIPVSRAPPPEPILAAPTSDPSPRPAPPATPSCSGRYIPPAPPLRARLATTGLALRAWLVAEIFRPAFRALVSTALVWRWADSHVILHGAGTGRGGPYHSARTPWVREFTETFTDPAWREDHVIKCSRSGFTEAALCVIRFMPDNAPGPVHLALDSAKAATDVMRERLSPTLRRHYVAEDTDDNDITARVVRLRNMVIRVTGSYTEGAFRQHGNRLVILDEVEVVNAIDGVGTLHDLARSRIRGVDG
ncbi:MAG: phage terminase large subunit family protein, partial [Undibacterium sp.]|nr:phage terminase large subunit family protein [Opitutaceae bacterium]